MDIKLTQTVQKGGCAAKLAAGTLRNLLKNVPLKKLPSLVVGAETFDDACLWDLENNHYLVQTVDFFTPIVDDPTDFGAIAAANALSDIYAMGGEPKIALTILAFPTQSLSEEVIRALFKGAVQKIEEAGACLAGGHTIDDETLKLGFCVTGFVKKGSEWKNSGAQEGDDLILTKGLGTGTITTALKNGEAKDSWVESATSSMKQLNQVLDLIGDIPIHAATDVTGFGLGGHALQMAEASQKQFCFQLKHLPLLEGARECFQNENLNRAHETNWDYVKYFLQGNLTSFQRWLISDPQTSGGLLLSLSKNNSEEVLKKLKTRFPQTIIIGEVQKLTEPKSFLQVF